MLPRIEQPVVCATCGHRRAAHVANQQMLGWPTCCGQLMSLVKTMPGTPPSSWPASMCGKKYGEDKK